MSAAPAPPIRVMVAEDEPAARRHVVRLVGRHDGFQVVAEAGSGTEALTRARACAPDVLLLDIQMPGADGFDVVRALEGPAMPIVVFITAYDTYAIRAFDVHAVDYLLKPFDDRRFGRTMASVRGHVEARTLSIVRGRISAMVAGRSPTSRRAPADARLTIRTGSGITFVPVAAVSHITADGYCAIIHTARRAYHVRESLLALAGRLPSSFARVHRSAIVNLHAVQSLEPLTHGEARARLAGGAEIKVSRSYRSALSPLLGT